MYQSNQNESFNFSAVEEELDSDLLARFSVFKKHSLKFAASFFSATNQFGSPQCIPLELLQGYFKGLNSLLIAYWDLPDRISDKLTRIANVEENADPFESANSIIKKMFADIKGSAEHKQLYFESIVYLTDVIEKIIYKQKMAVMY
jgi:hypothetical protein